MRVSRPDLRVSEPLMYRHLTRTFRRLIWWPRRVERKRGVDTTSQDVGMVTGVTGRRFHQSLFAGRTRYHHLQDAGDGYQASLKPAGMPILEV